MNSKSRTTSSKTTKQSKKTDLPKVSSIGIDDDIDELKRSIVVDLSQDAFDDAEARADSLRETNDLGTKLKLHKELELTIQHLESELNRVAGMIDIIDEQTIATAIHSSNIKTDIENDMINIEALKTKIHTEDVLQVKLAYMAKLIEKVENCKASCKHRKLTLSTVI
jgi:hypothetical protein